MTDNKHTPGPWGDKDKTIYVRGATWLGAVNWDDEEAKANARLIAAAPDMLEALKVVLQHGRIDDSESRMNLVAAAIAKAEAAA